MGLSPLSGPGRGVWEKSVVFWGVEGNASEGRAFNEEVCGGGREGSDLLEPILITHDLHDPSLDSEANTGHYGLQNMLLQHDQTPLGQETFAPQSCK